jgi:hypothetical protein
MRSACLSIACVGFLAAIAYLGAEPRAEEVKVRLRLTDAETGQGVGGIVRIFTAGSDQPLPLAGLLDRLRGIEKSETVAGWRVVPANGAEITLPRAKVRLEAFSGLETALAHQEMDLKAKVPEEVTVKLPFLFRPEKLGLVAGNTHLHLRGRTLEQATDYLKQVPAADGLKVLFISYLERNKDDASYITNRYSLGAPKELSGSGVLISNGEEHRHNFGAFGQGYGHVMLLNVKNLVKPVSLGPGITGGGFDDVALEPGIADARRQGGTILWCHNTNGHEGIVRALAGQLDAFNVFDGSRAGTYADKYYRYLNIGLRLPLSTGTDWFMYDFSRVYAKRSGPPSVAGWLAAVKAGRTVVTNGPLLTLAVDDRGPGDVLAIDKPRTVRVEVTGIGRHQFGELELVRNGTVIHKQPAVEKNGVFQARLTREVRIEEPAWFAARISTTARNELGQPLFAHTSPVYVDFAGKRSLDVEAARSLQRYLEESKADIRARGKFGDARAAEKIEAIYDQAIKDLVGRVNQRK